MKAKNIILMLVVLFLVVGCKGRKGVDDTLTITSKDIYTGTDGLSIEFLENAPPDEIFENSVLPIGLRLENKGAYDIKEGYLSIGLEKDYMELDEWSLKSINDRVDFSDSEHIQFDLKGKKIEHPQGEYDIITFTTTTKDLGITDPQSEYHDVLVSITGCYKYQTKAVETICIDTDVYGFKKREKACEVKTITLNSQGAPIAVTSIESEMLPDKDKPSIVKPRFTIDIKNLEKGEVIKGDMPTIRGACSSEPLGYKEWNIVNVKAYLSEINEENKLDCDIVKEGKNDDGTLILKQKEDKIRCVYEKGFDEKEGTFASPLYIILDYGYTGTISKNIKIKKIVK